MLCRAALESKENDLSFSTTVSGTDCAAPVPLARRSLRRFSLLFV
jgi:hypothetical protein